MTERLETYNAQIIRDAIPDFNYWIKKRFWSIYECATLSLNKEPRILTAEKMSLCWATDAEFVSKHEDLVSTINREFDWQEDLSKYEGKVNVLGKNNTTGKLHLGIAPEIYIKWVINNNIIDFPAKLITEYNDFIINARAKSLISAMLIADVWRKNDFAMILSIYNHALGDEHTFMDAIYAAVEARILTPINSSYISDSEPSERNYIFHPKSLVAWALSKKLGLPIEFNLIVDVPSNNATERKIPPSEKHARWFKEAKKIKEKDPHKTIPTLAKELFKLLLATDRGYVHKDVDELYPLETIKRTLRELFKSENKKTLKTPQW